MPSLALDDVAALRAPFCAEIQHGVFHTGRLSSSGLRGRNTGVGSLSLLQQIFPTQESNRGLLHCRQILSQLSHKGSPGHHQGRPVLPLTQRACLPLPGQASGGLAGKECGGSTLGSLSGPWGLGKGKAIPDLFLGVWRAVGEPTAAELFKENGACL